MTTVSSTGSTSSASSTSSAKTLTTLDASEMQDRFLKLLVAQLNNQDPLNPLDNAQVTTQLAQINTVRGIETLNTSVAKLVDRGNASSPLDAVGMLGKLSGGDRGTARQQHHALRIGFGDPKERIVQVRQHVLGGGAVPSSRLFALGECQQLDVRDRRALRERHFANDLFQMPGESRDGGRIEQIAVVLDEPTQHSAVVPEPEAQIELRAAVMQSLRLDDQAVEGQ